MYIEGLKNDRQLMTYSLYNILLLFGSLQGFLLCLLLLTGKQYQKRSNWFLILLLLAISLQNLSNALMMGGLMHVEYWPLSFTLLIPVSLYYFVVYLMNPKYESKKWEWVLIIPFMIQFLFKIAVFIAYLLMPNLLESQNVYFVWGAHLLELLAVLLSFGVLLNLIPRLNEFERGLEDKYSELESKTLKWLKNALIATFILWVLWSIPFTYNVLVEPFISLYPVWIGMSLITYWLAYSVLVRRHLFEYADSELLSIPQEENASPAIVEVSDKIEEHYQKLLALMEGEKLYNNPNLSMSILAEKMALSNGYLSKIINQKEQKNFFEFVNTYRVEEVKQKLKDPKFDHYSLLGIGLEAGFKSKSTFNAVFKKITGMTPSAYKNS